MIFIARTDLATSKQALDNSNVPLVVPYYHHRGSKDESEHQRHTIVEESPERVAQFFKYGRTLSEKEMRAKASEDTEK